MDDQARRVLAALAAWAPTTAADADDAAWLADFRCRTALLHDLGGMAEPVHSITHHIVRGVAGPISVRLYRPAPGPRPLLFHIHGGGAIAGTLDGHDPALRRLANRTGWLVAAPAYRLAPAHRFPAQLDDAHAALVALAAAADRLEIDAAHIVVSGDSIGGTLATALAMRCRGPGPALAGQVLLYPNTDLRAEADYPSRRSEDGNIIAAADLERQIGLYVAHEADRADGSCSPLLAPDLSRMPPAFVATCECDPLRDEGEAYAARLAAADVATRHIRFAGMIHAFLQMGGRIDATETLLAALTDWLKGVVAAG